MATSPTLKLDLVENVRVVERDGFVTELSRGAIVYGIRTVDKGIPGTGGALDPSTFAVRTALNHPDMPQPGDRHPTIPALFVRSREAVALGPSIVQVDVRYQRLDDGAGPPAPGFDYAIEGAAVAEQIESQTDRLGDQIIVEHNGIRQGATITADESRSTLRFTQSFGSAAPGVWARQWTNRVNSDAWQGDAAGTWRCMGISFRLVDPNTVPATWQFSYDFAYKQSGWQPKVVFVDRETGEPPADIDTGANSLALKTVDWYEAAPFLSLFPA